MKKQNEYILNINPVISFVTTQLLHSQTIIGCVDKAKALFNYSKPVKSNKNSKD